jgi:hypothetical protein
MMARLHLLDNCAFNYSIVWTMTHRNFCVEPAACCIYQVGQEEPVSAQVLASHPTQHNLQIQHEPQRTLDYHQIDPLGDDEQDEQCDLVCMRILA